MGHRLKSPTPKFFKKVQKIGGSMVILSGTLLAINFMPDAIASVAKYIGVIGGTMAALSQFAAVNFCEPTNPNNQQNPKI